MARASLVSKHSSNNMHLWGASQVQRLQLLLHKHWPAEQFPDLAELALANCGTVQKRDALAKATASLDVEQLRLLVCRQLGCASAAANGLACSECIDSAAQCLAC
jgi:hypothetical protein